MKGVQSIVRAVADAQGHDKDWVKVGIVPQCRGFVKSGVYNTQLCGEGISVATPPTNPPPQEETSSLGRKVT